MKGKKIVILLTVGSIFFAASLASATSFVSATVNRTRTVNGLVSVMLRYVSGSGCSWGAGARPDNVWFTVPSAMNDQALAVSLTAISLGKTVRVGIEQCPTTSDETGTVSSIGLDN